MVFFSGEQPSEEQIRFVVDFVRGDTSGLTELQEIEEAFQRLANNGKTDLETLKQQLGTDLPRSIHGTLPAMTELDTMTKNAKQSYQAFVNEGLIPTTNALEKNTKAVADHSNGISRWLVNSANAYGALGNLQRGLESVGPQFKVVGENAQELGFGLAGIAMGGTSAVLGIANIATAAFATFTEVGRQAQAFYNQMVVGAAVTGMNERQYATMATAANIAGVSLTQLTVVSQRLTKVQEDLSNGVDNTATRALKNLNVELKTTDGNLRDTYDVLQEVASAIDHKATQTEKLAAVEQLFGLRGKEALALLEDLNKTIPQATNLIDQHSGAYDNLKEKQQEVNLATERLNQQWNALLSDTGPAYAALINAIADAMGRLSGNTPQQGFRPLNLGEQVFGGFGLYVPSTSAAAGHPSEDDSANVNIGTRQPTGATSGLWGSLINEDAINVQTNEAERLRNDSLSKNKVWNSILGRWEDAPPKGSNSTGLGPLAASLKDLPAANSAYNESFGGASIPPAFELGGGKDTLNAWKLVNSQWSETIKIAKQHVLDAQVTVDRLSLTGDRSSAVFIEAQARVQGYTDAVRALENERHAALDQYTDDIEKLRQSLDRSKQVIRSVVLSGGPYTTEQAAATTRRAGGSDSFSLSGANPVFINQGVVTTQDISNWFAGMLNQTQRRGRTAVVPLR